MNILVINRKGGVGKTTICDELMFSFERSGIDAVYIDLDDQSSSIHQDRSERADTAEVVVVDTPGALSSDLRSWLENADAIVIPTNTSGRDIPMMIETLKAARTYAPGTPRIIVANRFNRYRASQEFLEVLSRAAETGEILATIAHGEAFQAAFSEDKSILQIAKNTNAALLTLETINKIRAAVGIEPDPIDPAPIRKYLERQSRMAKERRTSQIRKAGKSNA